MKNGTLPQVSWIFPTAQASEHPGDGPINGGPEYYKPIIVALLASPQYASTAQFITYDENDGYFDHVPPPQAPLGTPGEFLQGPAFGSSGIEGVNPQAGTINSSDPSSGINGPVGLGFRVPNTVISPWSRGGRVNSELFDHTSVLKLCETLFDVSPRGIVSDWRYNLVGDLTSTMDFSTTDTSASPQALEDAFVASQLLLANPAPSVETPPIPGTQPTQEQTPVRPRVGPTPAFATQAAPVAPAALPDAITPALLLGAGIAAATSYVAVNRIRSGGKPAARAGDRQRAALGEAAVDSGGVV